MRHKSPKNNIAMSPEITLPKLKQLNYLKRHNPMESKQKKTPKTITHKLLGNEAEDDPPTPPTSYTYSTNQEQ